MLKFLKILKSQNDLHFDFSLFLVQNFVDIFSILVDYLF
ncbi:hypothetical protein SAMN05421639_10740 [Chryseobacterium shigense]|uniref:Uncharacterized protein n=1 Tax=Chryseobacterium shigense TaxID=297244 RepID=A0A1N7JLX9_9FLAO|nr:hypothetical protein SAMN05421639_10740 [Chryseobacterium shigense]